MSCYNFLDGSRENPPIIPETDSDDEAPLSYLIDDTPDNPAIIDESDDKLLFILSFADLERFCREAEMIHEERRRKRRRSDSHTAETPNDRSSRWAEERAKLKKRFAQSPQEGDQDVKRKERKCLFKEAKEAIEKRRPLYSISNGGGIELNPLNRTTAAPTLVDMTLRFLADNSESIKSLSLIPDHLKKKLSDLVSDLGKVNKHFLHLLIQDSLSEISMSNCIDLEAEDLTRILCECDRVCLKVLYLDFCGRAVTENAIVEFLNRSKNGFPSLTTLSLQGSFCLTDSALALISRSAPLLRVINLSECPRLTSHAVKILADNFGSTLRGLDIGGCQGIKLSRAFMNNLSRFSKLNSLSVARLICINDEVLEFFIFRGSKLTDLSIASCKKMTDYTTWAIGRYCPKLEALDISDLDKLTDKSLEFITDGCGSLKSVKFTKNRFSDKAVAAFIEVCGGSLDQLCLKEVLDVGQATAISLAENCKRLRYLDLSWCRKLKEEELRRILSCCSLLGDSFRYLDRRRPKMDFLNNFQDRKFVSLDWK